MAKALVTGGLGFIGKHLVSKLRRLGHHVMVWDVKRPNDDSAYFIPVESCSPPFYDKGHFDVIFHLAAESRIQPSFGDPQKTFDTNVTGTQRILDLARYTGARVVFAGSSTVCHNMYANPYAFSKMVGEQYCTLYNRIYKVPVAIARFFNVYGPGQIEDGPYSTVVGIFERQKRLRMPLTITGTGEQRRDFVHVEDIVSALIAMSEQDWNAEVFELGTGENHSILEVAQMFNSSLEHQFLPKRPGEAWETKADISAAVEKLNWKPTRSLSGYIQSLAG